MAAHQAPPSLGLPSTLLQKYLIIVCVCVLVAQSCPSLCDPMDCSSPGSAVHGILQARILEQVTYSRGFSCPRDQTHVSRVSCIGSWILYHWATWEWYLLVHLSYHRWNVCLVVGPFVVHYDSEKLFRIQVYARWRIIQWNKVLYKNYCARPWIIRH